MEKVEMESRKTDSAKEKNNEDSRQEKKDTTLEEQRAVDMLMVRSSDTTTPGLDQESSSIRQAGDNVHNMYDKNITSRDNSPGENTFGEIATIQGSSVVGVTARPGCPGGQEKYNVIDTNHNVLSVLAI